MKKVVSVVLVVLTLMFSFSLVMASADYQEYYCCPYCNKIFTDVGDYEKCIISHDYYKLPNTFVCPVCGDDHIQPGYRNDCIARDIANAQTMTGTDPMVHLTCPECGLFFGISDYSGYNADVASHFPKNLKHLADSAEIVFPELNDVSIGWNNSAEFNIGVIIPESGKCEIYEITATGAKKVAGEQATNGGYSEFKFSTGNLTEEKTYRMNVYDSNVTLVSAQTFKVTPKTDFFAKLISFIYKIFNKQYPVKKFDYLTEQVQPS